MAEATINSRGGSSVVAALAGAWRRTPTAFEGSAADLEEVVPLLLKMGAAALCWWRVRHSDLRATPAAEELHQTYRLNTLQAALHQRAIEQVVTLLRSAEIEPILVKGWAAARLYPEMGLRPCGDIDLCVHPEQYAAADGALKSLKGTQYEVDLHSGFDKFGRGSFDGFYDRSQLVQSGETCVRVLCAEDHLRILCVHLLREGAWRPLWLCDIAVAVESRLADFDWDVCLTKDRVLADWILCAITLAQQLLGARVDGTPAARRTRPLPRWLIPTILKEWESRLPSMSQRHRAPMAGFLNYPAEILKGLHHRWPNRIEATVSMRAPFNELPRLPFQIGNCVARTAKFAARLPKLLLEQ
jgi:hypothetical protein